eukprot:gene5850-4173_t
MSSSTASLSGERLTCPQFDPAHLHLSSAIPLGSGAISQVVRSELRFGGTADAKRRTPIAVKIMSKIQVLHQHKVQAAMDEKEAFLRLAPSPFITRLFGTAQAEDELYFVMEYLPHGDLLQHIRSSALQRVKAFNGMKDTALGPEGATACEMPQPQPPLQKEKEKEKDIAMDIFAVGAEKAATGMTGKLLRPIPTDSPLLRCLDFHDVQLISAQLVMGLARVFEKGLVLRDFKPENVGFDDHYRACLFDFDTVDLLGGDPFPTGPSSGGDLPTTLGEQQEQAKKEQGEAGEPSAAPRRRRTVSQIQLMRQRTSSFCGTAQYVSPEMVSTCRWNFSSDLWALGATVYEMAYGVHMFHGEFTFAVLKKIMAGEGAIKFPYINFEETETNSSERFERLKSFILSLAHTNPRRRLGVHPDTGAFDLDAIRSHPFFADFDWEVLDRHVREYRPHDFRHPPPLLLQEEEEEEGVRRRSSSSSCASSCASSSAAACAPAVFGAFEDETPSLRSLYHMLPSNDPRYADYVYRATADANPFERLLFGGGSSPLEEEEAATQKQEEEEEDEKESEEDDVIDDVGMHYRGTVPAFMDENPFYSSYPFALARYLEFAFAIPPLAPCLSSCTLIYPVDAWRVSTRMPRHTRPKRSLTTSISLSSLKDLKDLKARHITCFRLWSADMPPFFFSPLSHRFLLMSRAAGCLFLWGGLRLLQIVRGDDLVADNMDEDKLPLSSSPRWCRRFLFTEFGRSCGTNTAPVLVAFTQPQLTCGDSQGPLLDGPSRAVLNVALCTSVLGAYGGIPTSAALMSLVQSYHVPPFNCHNFRVLWYICPPSQFHHHTEPVKSASLFLKHGRSTQLIPPHPMAVEISRGLIELQGFISSTAHLTVVDFYADWCGPCQRAKPAYHALSQRFTGKKVKFITCNADRHPDCMQRYNVHALPTFLILYAGEELLRTNDVNEVSASIDAMLLRVRSAGGGGGSSGAAGRSTGTQISGHPVLSKMIHLGNILLNNGDRAEENAAVEAVRSHLFSAASKEPLGLALIPYLASDAGQSSGGRALESLLSNLLRLAATQSSTAYNGVAEGIVNNVLRYVMHLSLSLTWNEREAVGMLHTVLQSLLLSSTAQRLLIQSPYFLNPVTVQTGKDLEYQTVLGGLLGVGPFARSGLATAIPQGMLQVEYMTLATLFPADGSVHETRVSEVQMIVDTLALKNNELVGNLLRSKETREATMTYFAEALRLNVGYQKTVHQDLPLSSIYFLTQVEIVLLTAAKPIFTGPVANQSPAARIPPSYLLDDDPETGSALVVFEKDVERVTHFGEERPLPPPPTHLPAAVSSCTAAATAAKANASSGIVGTSPTGTSAFVVYKPVVHLFYLAVQAACVITVPMVDNHRDMQRQAQSRRGSSENQVRERTVVTALYRIREGLLGSSTHARLRLGFCNDLSNWLLNVMEVNEALGELPKEPPIAWQYLPQQVVDCAVKATELATMGDVYTPHLHGLLLLLMGNTVYFPKPHTHVFSYLLTRILSDRSASTALRAHQWFSRNIVRSCMNCYIAVEKAIYERTQVRFDLSRCLKQFLESETLCAPVREELSNPENTFLERFSHMAVTELNSAIDEMTETLKKMNKKIKEGANLSPEAQSEQRGQEGQQRRRRPRAPENQDEQGNDDDNNNDDDEEEEEEEGGEGSTTSPTYHQLGLSLHSYISLFFVSTDLFMSLARCFPDGVSRNMVAKQLSQVLARSLVTFAGRHCGQLKIQNEQLYRFSPREILARLVDCLTPLTSNTNFLRCLCECGEPQEDILDAIDRILNRQLVSSRHQGNLEVMRGAIVSLSGEVEEEAELYANAPDYVLDALMCEPLKDPVALPAEVKDTDSLVYVNRETIRHVLLSDNKHPFTKEYLDEAILDAFNAKPEVVAAREKLQRKIEEWRTEAKRNRK